MGEADCSAWCATIFCFACFLGVIIIPISTVMYVPAVYILNSGTNGVCNLREGVIEHYKDGLCDVTTVTGIVCNTTDSENTTFVAKLFVPWQFAEGVEGICDGSTQPDYQAQRMALICFDLDTEMAKCVNRSDVEYAAKTHLVLLIVFSVFLCLGVCGCTCVVCSWYRDAKNERERRHEQRFARIQMRAEAAHAAAAARLRAYQNRQNATVIDVNTG